MEVRMYYRKIKLLVLLFAIVTLLSGCGKPKEQKQIVAPTGTSYTVVDSQGTKVTIPKKPLKILSQSLTFDTMILGIVPPERMAAACFLDQEPDSSYIIEETKNIKPVIHSFTSIPTELVIQIKPDVIILPSTNKPEMINAFRDLGYPVVVCKTPRNIEDIKNDIKLIAQTVQEEDAGRRVIAEMDRQMADIKATLDKRTGKKPVAMLVSKMTNYGGKGSMFDELCNNARVINGIAAVGINNGEKLTKELVVAADPDFFLVSKPKVNDVAKAEEFKQEFLNDPALEGMRALKHIIPIPNKYLYSNSQNCVWAIKGIANYAYGDVFDMSQEKLIKGY